MPRPLRIDIPGLFYHVYCRGVKQLPLFGDDEDRIKFLDLFGEAQTRFPFLLHSYSLMTNHYHFLLQTVKDSLSTTIGLFQNAYARWVNNRYDHKGHVFESRFCSIPVDSERYFLTLARYIHLNSVKAGIVERPEDYRWSDYSALIAGKKDRLVTREFLLGHFAEDEQKQVQLYRTFVEDGLGKRELIKEDKLRFKRFWGDEKRALEARII